MRAVVAQSSAETERLAAEFAQRLGPGDIVLVIGDIGAGKTTFVRGASRGLGVTGPVTSPTFTIGQVYPVAGPGHEDPIAGGRRPAAVAHLDLYRVADPTQEEPGFIDEYATGDRVTFIEWPGGIPEMPPNRRVLEVRLDPGSSEDERRVLLP